MKKYYNEPIIHVVMMDSNDIVCASNEHLDNSVDVDAGARVRHNAIWDDYEN